MGKKFLPILLATIALLGLSGCKHQTSSTHNRNSISSKNKKKDFKTTSKRKSSRSKQPSSGNTNNKPTVTINEPEWVLMGYMTYARKNYEQSKGV